jgi:ABC-type multidrug transport system fused ATPase/permease subunit
MTSSLKYAKETFFLLGESRNKLPWILILFLLSAALDIIGLGLIVPYVSLVIDPSIAGNGIFSNVFQLIGQSQNLNDAILLFGLLLLVVYLAKAFAGYFISRAILNFSWQQQVRLRTSLMKAYQGLPYKVYLRRNSSEYLETILGLTSQFSGGVVMNGLKLVSDGIVGLAILFLLALVNPFALIVLIVFVGGTVLLYDRLFRSKLKEFGKRVAIANEQATKAVQEGIRGFKEVRVLGAERVFWGLVESNSRDLAKATVSRDVIIALPRYLLDFMLFLFVVSIVSSSFVLGYERQDLIPTLSLFGVGSLRLVPIANSLSGSLVGFRFNRYATSRLYSDFRTINKEATLVNQKSVHVASDSFKSLKVDNITFCYEGAEKPTLRNLSFEVIAGDSIGIMGPSGSGKTTFVDLVLGMLEPRDGEIFYNDRPLKIEMPNWLSQVAYLPQDGFMIDGTLCHNIVFGSNHKEVDQERLRHALHQSQLFDLIEELPNGVETMVGENGVRLSGGQRQRVSIARALYRGRNVLIMDEATSALDTETEREIVDEIERLKGTITTVVIAHRASTLKHCDRIYSLERGEMVDVGIRGQKLS